MNRRRVRGESHVYNLSRGVSLRDRSRENLRRYRQRLRLPLHEIERLEQNDTIHTIRALAHLVKLAEAKS